MKIVLKRIAFWLVLWPLIKRDLRLRNAGKRPDRWYWADELAAEWCPYDLMRAHRRWNPGWMQ